MTDTAASDLREQVRDRYAAAATAVPTAPGRRRAARPRLRPMTGSAASSTPSWTATPAGGGGGGQSGLRQPDRGRGPPSR